MSAEAGAAGAPPLADALRGAAASWQAWIEGQSLDRALLAAWPAELPRSPALQGAVRDLASAAVRRRAVLEHILGELLHRPAEAPVRALLAVALAQLLAGSYTDFTLVDQAVSAARAVAATAPAAGFVNAVLRAFLRRRQALEAAARADPARRANLPSWWWRKLQRDCGPRAEEVVAAQAEEPPLVLRVNLRRGSVEQQLQRLGDAGMAASQVGAQALWLHRPVPVERIPGFAQGLVSVQDAGAQLAAPWLGAAAGMRVLDACAAPGGKTAHLLELADCRVDAIELDAARARRIEENLQRLGLPLRAPDAPADACGARILVDDALHAARHAGGRPYDRILLDAPCTASGVLRRHPDAAWLRRPADVANLATRQGKMLDALWPLLAPAGRLLYVVCSVFAEEGRGQIAAFLRRQPGARALAIPPGGPSGEALGLLLLPTPVAVHDMGSGPAQRPRPATWQVPWLHDGFFYALIEKT